MRSRTVVAAAAISAALLTFGAVSSPEAGAQALRAPKLAVTPDSAEAGRTVTVSGNCAINYFPEGPAVPVELVLQGAGEDVFVADLSLDADGNFDQTVMIPNVPATGDSYDLSADVYHPTAGETLVDCGGEANFYVVSLDLDRDTGEPGEQVNATGVCPWNSGSVDIFFGGESLGSATVDSESGAFGLEVTVPDVPADDYEVTTGCGGHASFEVLAPVLSTLTLDATSGHVGDEVSATGTCPVDSESYGDSVEIFFVATSVGSATVDSSTGAFGPVGFPVPDVAPGFHDVQTSCDGNASFEVLPTPVVVDPTLALDPTSGHVGDGVSATGTCPVDSGSVEIFFEGESVGSATMNSSTGAFGPVGFLVPDVDAGSHDVTTSCDGSAAFEVVATPVQPALTLDPVSGQVGNGVSATGTCPVDSGSVEILFDDTPVGSATVNSSTGEFGPVEFDVPNLLPGSYGVTTNCGGEAFFDVLPVGVIPATLELDPAQGELGVDVTASGTCALDHPDVTLLVDDRTVATTGVGPQTGEFEVVFPVLGVEGPTHTVTTSCGASQQFTLLFPVPSTTSAGPGTRAEPRRGGAPGAPEPRARPNRPRSQLPTSTPIDTPQGIRIIVPDLTGLTEDEVITALGDHLTLAGRTGDVGVVVRQLPLAGTLVEPASAVSILLAEPELAPLESGTSRPPLAVLTVLFGALIGALLYGERVRRRRARERRWVDTDVRTELETAEPALSDVPDRPTPGLDVRLELRRDPEHLTFQEVGRAHD